MDSKTERKVSKKKRGSAKKTGKSGAAPGPKSTTSATNATPNPTTHTTAVAQPTRSSYSLANIWIVSLSLKALLFFAYHSTDFDVHRNWLAITYHLPISRWYVEDTSQWTLDYPPFFAYFEWVLSHLVPQIVKDDGCLDIVEKGAYGLPTVLFQRLTVIVSEVVLFASLQWYVNTSQDSLSAKNRAFVVASSLILSPGLLIIDHIHFQYNGMMYGFFIFMITSARLKRYLLVGFWFSLLLCFKHIYLYVAPAVFIFLLRAYCLDLQFDKQKSFLNNLINLVRWTELFKLSSVVITVFTVAFGPFVYHGSMSNLLSRLFPFSRGLTHAYWAPNIWAIYSFFDRLFIYVYKQVPLSRSLLVKVFQFDPMVLEVAELVNSSTRGLVGDIELVILPTITPQLTFLLTLFYQIMALVPLFLQPTYHRFIGAITLCAYDSFLFGWHVHEKAILLVIFPMTLLVTTDKRLLGPFNLLVSCGYTSLFPLIYTSAEWPVKVVYTLLWYIIYYFNFGKIVKIPKQTGDLGGIILDRVTNGYILGLCPIFTIVTIIDIFEHHFEVLRKLEFMKLMIVSVYCGVGVVSSWNGLNWLYFVHESIWNDIED
ncbi:dolichyl pyrophosphate Glc1Man9GlcNAc2 alpha-1,3-glucosyltransferase [[Candida] anglica]|uniref:Alpha-1,3-glucosyltransferase n=1 Tax=[Candida] anglica TaxID=148631 RepID=A0ABP0EMS6_9ASCO